jgi:hypothetical protein
VEEAQAQLKAALVSMRIQETMRDHVIAWGRPRTNVNLKALDGQGPVGPQLPDSANIQIAHN